ncbi:5-hydroxytryptamine receptor 4-like [Dendronephthya gigantea]|uniref:5-hydroxytryptamine receptor 4-like n=1 Tax=Dendronephthya gigantea TaxID=151771 RepID=UPI00106CB1B4|nr:5-hydroxytryptamine receptor 4-like [Dendronephthya gigantea]XP_028396438.1 5-hydroxytryptamine receptor 4-like [Dendronephthya gigantea]
MTDSAFVILVEVLLSIILVVIVLGNLFVIEAVCRHVRLRTIPNICIVSLAVADLFVGLLNIPMYMYAIYNENHSRDYNLALDSLDMYFGASSILHLALISMERCYAITCPLRRRFLQKGTVIKILIFLWLAAITPVVIYVLKVPSWPALVLIVCFLVPLIIIVTSYTILMISAKISRKKMEKHRVQQTSNDIKLAKTLCIVVVVFITTWTPFFIVLANFVYPEHLSLNLTVGQQTYLSYFVKFFQYASSACNPFIYAFRQREFTNALHHLRASLKKHNCERSSDSVVCGDSRATRKTTTKTSYNRFLKPKSFERNEQLSLTCLNDQTCHGNNKKHSSTRK